MTWRESTRYDWTAITGNGLKPVLHEKLTAAARAAMYVAAQAGVRDGVAAGDLGN